MATRDLLSAEQFDQLLAEVKNLKPAAKPKDVMTTEEAAAFLSMSTQNLEVLRLNGGGPKYAKLGRLVRYRREALDAWLIENEQSNTAESAR